MKTLFSLIWDIKCLADRNRDFRRIMNHSRLSSNGWFLFFFKLIVESFVVSIIMNTS